MGTLYLTVELIYFLSKTYFCVQQNKFQSDRSTRLEVLVVYRFFSLHLLFENPLTFNCFWAIKNIQLTLMPRESNLPKNYKQARRRG